MIGVKLPSTRRLSAGSGPYSATQPAKSRGNVAPIDVAAGDAAATFGAGTLSLASVATVPASAMRPLRR